MGFRALRSIWFCLEEGVLESDPDEDVGSMNIHELQDWTSLRVQGGALLILAMEV